MFVAMVIGILLAGVLAAPELTAFATQLITGADIKNNSITHLDIGTNAMRSQEIASKAVTSAEIKDGTILADDIATDAVGSAELAGVTKLLFGQCEVDDDDRHRPVNPTAILVVDCVMPGTEEGDSVIATVNKGSVCFDLVQALSSLDEVTVRARNTCPGQAQIGDEAEIAVVVYDK